MWATFERFELQMTLQQAESCAHPGDCLHDVEELAAMPHIQRQRKKIDPDLIRQELKEYGAYSEEDLQDDDMNWVRILWIGANDISEENFMKRSKRA